MVIHAYKQLHQILTKRGFQPRLHLLDNEAPKELKTFLDTQHIQYQLVPPHVHRRNAAERAIRTFKEQFVAGLCSTDKNFPMHLWDRLLPQAIITLNLLRASRQLPQLSAYTHVFGNFDFNKTPLATWHTSHRPQQTFHPPLLGTPRRNWLVFRPSPRALSMLQGVYS